MYIVRPCVRAALVLSALLCVIFAGQPVVAGDVQETARIVGRLPPELRQAYLQRLAARQQTARSTNDAQNGTTLDVTPPIITGFDAPKRLYIQSVPQIFGVTVAATDDLSGVMGGYFYATGPSGQTLMVAAYSKFPTTKFQSIAGFAQVSPSFVMLEPGTWEFWEGWLFDAAGNSVFVDHSALQYYGNTTFTVVNTGSYDYSAPSLISGRILTPIVSLSSLNPGTVEAPYVKVLVNTADSGNSQPAGVWYVQMSFCKIDDPNVCIYPGGDSWASGQAKFTFSAGTQVSGSNGDGTGTYELGWLTIRDYAGNYSEYKSPAFGGTTDFRTYFPGGTKIKLSP